jgi:hypothetical protein
MVRLSLNYLIFNARLFLGENQPVVPKPKKFFKSRSDNVDCENTAIQATVTSAKLIDPTADEKPARKFFLKGRNSSTDDPLQRAPPPEIPPPLKDKQRPPGQRTPLERSPMEWSPVRPPLGK